MKKTTLLFSITLPSGERPLHKTLETVATLLEADGHQVTTLPAERFAGV